MPIIQTPIHVLAPFRDDAEINAVLAESKETKTSSAAVPASEGAQLVARGRDRVLTLLILEDAEPRRWDNSWKDEESQDSFDKFTSSGQLPVR